jgi:hypothetical protein
VLSPQNGPSFLPSGLQVLARLAPEIGEHPIRQIYTHEEKHCFDQIYLFIVRETTPSLRYLGRDFQSQTHYIAIG